MASEGDLREGVEAGLGLAKAIGVLRDELLAARAGGAKADIQLPVQSMTVELRVVATREKGGKAGFQVPIVPVELGGSIGSHREATHTVTVTFGGPIDRAGRPVPVAEESNEPLG
jgi:1-acyl-sn-glycerol-3-phosphate acyltransferase